MTTCYFICDENTRGAQNLRFGVREESDAVWLIKRECPADLRLALSAEARKWVIEEYYTEDDDHGDAFRYFDSETIDHDVTLENAIVQDGAFAGAVYRNKIDGALIPVLHGKESVTTGSARLDERHTLDKQSTGRLIRRMTVSEAMQKMIEFNSGNQHEVEHFLKVWAYARTIGQQEGLDEKTQKTLEYAAVVHDIACPKLKAEHGSCPGVMQQEIGGPMAREFYKDSGLPQQMIDRIVYLVEHHHTFSNVEGMDYQILLEADFLVNAGEQDKYHRNIQKFHDDIFKTKTGLNLLEAIYMTR
jgi:hypothetical protein